MGIFPGSRVSTKNLPVNVIDRINSSAAGASLRSTLFLLEGERRDLENADRPHRIVPRSFSALIEAIASVDLVVSADSLPAHLGERLGKPVFVVSPVPNHYWLPLSSVRLEHHCIFDDVGRDSGLKNFLF